MPIRPDLRQFYGAAWRKVTRPRILERAENRCETCGKPNGKQIECRYDRILGQPNVFWIDRSDPIEHWRDSSGSITMPPRYYLREKVIKVVLTVAHLNQTAGDDRDENLRALCQYCHLRHDRQQHSQNAHATRAARKDAGRPLLAILEAAV